MNKRQQIVDAIQTRFEAIAEFGDNVIRHPLGSPAEDQLPAILWKDTDGIVIELGTFLDHTMMVETEIWTKSDTPDDDVRALLADLLAAIGEDETWGGLAYKCELSEVTMATTASETPLGGARVVFRVTYRTPRWQI